MQKYDLFTIGVIRNETLVFVNFSAQDASILKISVPRGGGRHDGAGVVSRSVAT